MAHCSIAPFAIVAGVLGLVTVVKALLWRRRLGHGGGCGHRARWGRGPGRSFWLRSLFSRLDTTPGQEREIRAAIEELQARARDAKDGLKSARADIASAIRGDAFDADAAEGASARADATAAQVKDAFAAALRRVHAVLDPKQRERLADLVANGPGFSRGWGPYR